MKTTIISLALIIIISPCTCKGWLKCGDELRVETYLGDTLQGKLQYDGGDSLVLISSKFELSTIVLNDVKSAYYVNRKTKEGTKTGLAIGLILGTAAAYLWYNERENPCEGSNELVCYDTRYIECILIGVTGIALGALVGKAIIRHNSHTLHKVQLESLPVCLSPSGDKIQFMISLAINF